MTKKVLLGAMVALMLIAFVPESAQAAGAAEARAGAAPAAAAPQVAVVFGRGGRGDQSFNDAAYRGLERAGRELGVRFDFAEPQAVAEFEGFLTQFAARGTYALIVSIGFEQGDALRAASARFPNQKFAIIDTIVEAPNVTSYVYREQERGFLMGAAAAITTLDAANPMTNSQKKVAVVGGVQSPLINANIAGFLAGARYIDPTVEAAYAYVGSFADPARGKEIAISLIEAGADVVWGAAGRSGLGVLDAAKERGVYGMGADSDQGHVAPGHVLSNGMKLVDETVFIAIKTVVEGRFAAGVTRLGVSDGALGYSRSLLSPAAITRLEDIRAKIISGEIRIADTIEAVQAR